MTSFSRMTRAAILAGFASTASVPALAATGTISIYASGSVLIENRTSNFSGLTHCPAGRICVQTATFTNLTNTSGSFTALLGSLGGPDITCDGSFVTIVTNGVCKVQVSNTGNGQCTAGAPTVNAQTCDFSVDIYDNIGTGGSGPSE